MPAASSALPKSWPSDVIYLTQPTYSKFVPLSLLQIPKGAIPKEMMLLITPPPQTPYSGLRITPITNTSHPAHGQHGLFATRHHPPESFLCFYLGLVHTAADTDPDSDYDLRLSRDPDVSVDATRMGNEARFINDFRGVRDDGRDGGSGPNAEFRDCWVDLGRGGGGERMVERRIGVFVLSAGKKGGRRAKGIMKGEEIVVSYGKGFWMHRDTV